MSDMNNYEFIIWFLTVTWAGPIGIGFLLMGLGVFYWGRSLYKRADRATKVE